MTEVNEVMTKVPGSIIISKKEQLGTLFILILFFPVFFFYLLIYRLVHTPRDVCVTTHVQNPFAAV